MWYNLSGHFAKNYNVIARFPMNQNRIRQHYTKEYKSDTTKKTSHLSKAVRPASSWKLRSSGRIYLQAVVDTYGSYGFAKLYTGKRPETAVDILYEWVLPFYHKHKLPIQAVSSDNGTAYLGRPMVHMYEIFLDLNDI